jgi:hypothetical protein
MAKCTVIKPIADRHITKHMATSINERYSAKMRRTRLSVFTENDFLRKNCFAYETQRIKNKKIPKISSLSDNIQVIEPTITSNLDKNDPAYRCPDDLSVDSPYPSVQLVTMTRHQPNQNQMMIINHLLPHLIKIHSIKLLI